MPIIFESQIYCSCDQCGAWWATQVFKMNEAKQYLRSLGWSIGSSTYCPACNPKRKKVLKNE